MVAPDNRKRTLMVMKRFLLAVVVVGSCFFATCRSQNTATIDSARMLMLDGMRRSGIPGASVTVMKHGKIIWSEGLGFSDVENRVPVTPQTKFRVGSVSKPLTAAALALLVEQGKLDLDAPVQRYVPSFPQKKYPITTRELGGHLAGVRHYAGNEFLNQRHYNTVTDGLTIFKDDTLLFKPGDRYSYSSYGWNLISAVIEGASGESFLALMRKRVFDAIGMTHTAAEYTDSIIPFRAHFYSRSDSAAPVVNAPFVDNSYKWAGGGFLSTTEDLVLFGQTMLLGTFVRPHTRELLWTSQRTTDGKQTGYGIGWSVLTDSSKRRIVSHSGGSVGGTAWLQIFPDQQLVAAFLFNGDGRQPPVRRIADMFLRSE